MSVNSPQELSNIESYYHARDTYLTDDGQALLETNPDLLEDFFLQSYNLVNNFVTKDTYSMIDWGSFSHVYELGADNNFCVKVSTQDTIRKAKKYGPHIKAPSLRSEAWFMSKVEERLSKSPDSGVRAPKQYGVVRFNLGSVMLQERIPRDFVRFGRLEYKARHSEDETEAIIEREQKCYERVVAVLGHSLLNLGIGDMQHSEGRIHNSNMLVREEADTSDPIYIIDLIGSGTLRRAAIMGGFLLSKSLPSLPARQPSERTGMLGTQLGRDSLTKPINRTLS